MSASVLISDEVMAEVARMSQSTNVPCEELVEKALAAYVRENDMNAGLPEWPELDAVFGTWKDRGEDTFAYLKRIRGE